MKNEYMTLTKWNSFLSPKDTFEKNRLLDARNACGLLLKMTRLGDLAKKSMATCIARLSRTAMLTLREREAIFGPGVIEAGLFEEVRNGNVEAIVLTMLDRIDEGSFAAAAKLAADVPLDDWTGLAIQNYSKWEHTHCVDAAIICCIANRFASVEFLDELQEMQIVVEEKHPTFLERIETD